MPFYLEYTVNDISEVRSAMPGDHVEDAAAAATELLRESDCQSGVLRWCADSSGETGTGEVVAVYRDTDGWNFAGFHDQDSQLRGRPHLPFDT